MRNRIALPAVAPVVVAVLLALTACDPPPSHRAEAKDLRAQLADLPGVAEVDLRYVQPQALDPADVDLMVTMADDADPAAVAAVFETAYEGLVDVHREEEGNLEVEYGDDELHLRTFNSVAEPADVGDAARSAAVLALEHDRLFGQVMTQDVHREPHVSSLVLVFLPKGTTRAEVAAVRSRMRRAYDDDALVRVDVRVRKRRR